MLYVTYRKFRETYEQTWHVGQPDLKIPPHQVQELQADGDEAATIEDIMGGVLVNRPVKRFWGDVARTIYCNLFQEV